MKDDGSVVYWGNPNTINDIYYQNAAEINLSGYYKFPEEQLRSNVKSISSTEHAYAAIKEDGSVVTWGAGTRGGTLECYWQEGALLIETSPGVSKWLPQGSAFNKLQSGVKEIHSTRGAFAALKEDGSVVIWGKIDGGGSAAWGGHRYLSAEDLAYINSLSDATSMTNELYRLSHKPLEERKTKEIVACSNGFAALREDGTIYTWGAVTGITSNFQDSNKKFISITSNSGAFAAIAEDGSVSTWGENRSGGNMEITPDYTKTYSIKSKLNADVIKIIGAGQIFSALKKDGSVVIWGKTTLGAGSNAYPSELLNGVSEIFTDGKSFYAKKEDLSYVIWSLSRDHIKEEKINSYKGNIKTITNEGFYLKDDKLILWDYLINSKDSPLNGLENDLKLAFQNESGTYAVIKEDGTMTTWGNTEGIEKYNLEETFTGFADPFELTLIQQTSEVNNPSDRRLSGNLRDYKFYNRGSGKYEIKTDSGFDEITGMSLEFNDQTIDAVDDIKGVFDQITGLNTDSGEMFRLYNAAFARFPDASGLEYWIDQFSSGRNTRRVVAQSFLNSSEFKERYGENVVHEVYVNNLYKNVLGREADPAGIIYWTTQLLNGTETRYEVLLGFSESAENKALFTEMTGFG